MNNSLEEDRRSLMSQVSMLLQQYHDLLTQTLDDKEAFHEEEKVRANALRLLDLFVHWQAYTDRMNHLHRQKEKLEEKIMEQYKKMENSTPKKCVLYFESSSLSNYPASLRIGFGGQLKKFYKASTATLLPSSGRGRSQSRGRENGQQQQHKDDNSSSGDAASVGSGEEKKTA